MYLHASVYGLSIELCIRESNNEPSTKSTATTWIHSTEVLISILSFDGTKLISIISGFRNAVETALQQRKATKFLVAISRVILIQLLKWSTARVRSRTTRRLCKIKSITNELRRFLIFKINLRTYVQIFPAWRNVSYFNSRSSSCLNRPSRKTLKPSPKNSN